MRTDTGKIFRLEDYKQTEYAILSVKLLFKLDAQKTVVTAKTTFQRRDSTPAGTPLILDGDGLVLELLKINDKAAGADAYTVSADQLTILVPPAGESFSIEVVTIINPDSNRALMGLYKSGNVYCTQCEAEGFRRITYFLDRPDILAVYTVRIEAMRDEAPLLLANGNPVNSGDLPDGRHFAEWHDPFPKPSYLFALVAGDLGCIEDTFTTMSGREVVLRIYVEHGKESRATYAMDSLIRSMKWDEEVFSREYDLDLFMIVAVSSFNMGAMENKGLNIFNDKYVLADPDTATDADYTGIEAVIAHEYFHNWTGNRITCRDWFQLCLKEGLTVFRDHEFSADMRSRAVKRIAEIRNLKANQFPEDQGPLAHPVRPRKYREINNFYTATVYEKGSEVVRMIRTILGEAAFKAGLRLYFERHDGEAATIENFLACFEESSQRDLSQFSLWYHQAGTPTVMVTAGYNKALKKFTLELEQVSKPTPGESRKRLMHIPVKFALISKSGQKIRHLDVEGAGISGDVIHLRKKKQRFVFNGIAERPIASLLRGFSAPVTLAFEQKPEDHLFLARHDDDLVSRWQALNTASIEALIQAVNMLRGGRSIRFDPALPEILGELSSDSDLEPAFRALALTLPLEGDIAREIGRNVDPDAIHRARNCLINEAAATNTEIFDTVIESLRTSDAFAPDAISAGKRALKNVLLDYVSANLQHPARAAKEFSSATNMTDRLAALSILCSRFAETSQTEQALREFEKRHAHDSLTMDKWFATQAMIPGPKTLERVVSLTKHNAFSFANPNRMRSLIGTFATSNPTGFHRSDGSGYRFISDFVLELDTKNPQTAARILTAMRSWRSLEPVRRDLARLALASIGASKSLSADVRDIVDRILA
jgi:aminopeptidase N